MYGFIAAHVKYYLTIQQQKVKTSSLKFFYKKIAHTPENNHLRKAYQFLDDGTVDYRRIAAQPWRTHHGSKVCQGKQGKYTV
jgi:hypothetical protein